MSPKILFMGISSHDPGFPLPHGVEPAKLDALINGAAKSLTDAGYDAKLFLPDMSEGVALLKTELHSTKYDAVVLGGGLRTQKPLLLYFEEIVNTIVKEGNGAKIGFNAGLEDKSTLEAAQRLCPL